MDLGHCEFHGLYEWDGIGDGCPKCDEFEEEESEDGQTICL